MPWPKAKGAQLKEVKAPEYRMVVSASNTSLPCSRGPAPFNISETLWYAIAGDNCGATVHRRVCGCFCGKPEITVEMIIGSVTNSR